MITFLRRWLAPILLLLASQTGAEATPPRVGSVAPDFQLTLVDGSHVRLSELRGQVVVLNFWATWCVPCRAELPLLDRYYRLRRDAGLRVFAVTTEDSLPLYQLHRLFDAMAIPSARAVRAPMGRSTACRRTSSSIGRAAFATPRQAPSPWPRSTRS